MLLRQSETGAVGKRSCDLERLTHAAYIGRKINQKHTIIYVPADARLAVMLGGGNVFRSKRNFVGGVIVAGVSFCGLSKPKVFARRSYAEGSDFEILDGHRFRVFERRESGRPLVRVSASHMRADLTDESRRLILFGEEHGHPLCHHLERDLYAAWLESRREGDSVSISLEMLSTERRNAVQEYYEHAPRKSGKEEESVFGGEWANWVDYADLVRMARENGESVVCANAPRRLTSMLAKGGENTLLRHLSSDEGKSDLCLISPLPLRKPSAELCAAIGPIFETFRGKRDLDRRDRMLLAQTLWDSTMAYSIAR